MRNTVEYALIGTQQLVYRNYGHLIVQKQNITILKEAYFYNVHT